MNDFIQILEIKEHIETEPILKVVDGKIFVEGVETTDDELIGIAFKDFAEQLKNKIISTSPLLCIGEDWSSENILNK